MAFDMRGAVGIRIREKEGNPGEGDAVLVRLSEHEVATYRSQCLIKGLEFARRLGVASGRLDHVAVQDRVDGDETGRRLVDGDRVMPEGHDGQAMRTGVEGRARDEAVLGKAYLSVFV